jgi:hypothetical protein
MIMHDDVSFLIRTKPKRARYVRYLYRIKDPRADLSPGLDFTGLRLLDSDDLVAVEQTQRIEGLFQLDLHHWSVLTPGIENNNTRGAMQNSPFS